MQRKVRHTVHDILEVIGRLEGKTAGKSFDDFNSDWELQFLVERGIEIISEATRRIPEELKAKQPQIEWRSIAAIGNVLRHEYHTISKKVVWDVVQADLPPLKQAVLAIAEMLEE